MNVWQRFKARVAKFLNMNVLPEAGMDEESFLEWLGIGQRRRRRNGMAEVTYFTCLKIMSETLAKIPWK